MTQKAMTCTDCEAPHRAHSAGGIWNGLYSALLLVRSRRSLAHIDDRLLDDVGISPDQARAEAQRPIWDVPQRWIR